MNQIQNSSKPNVNLCRVCMGISIHSHQMNSLITITIDTLSLSQMFTICTSIIPLPKDGLPDQICSNCVPNLVAAYKFKLQCIKSDTEMRRSLDAISGGNACPIELVNSAGNTERIEMIDVSLIKQENTENDFQIDTNCYETKVINVAGNLNEQTTSKSFKCEICNSKYAQKYGLKRHQKQIKHGQYYIKSLNLDEDTKNISKVVFNTISNKKELISRESESNNGTSSEDIISTSVVEIDGTKHYKCEICSRLFQYLRNLLTHIITHTEFKSFTCTTCGEKFALASQLVEHEIVHKDDNPFVCLKCNKKFHKRSRLHYHNYREHREQMKIPSALCPKCGKAFKKSGDLKKHLQTHLRIKQYSCNQCTAKFHCKTTRNKHIFTHSGNKPFKCDMCESSFSRNSLLTIHKSCHKNERLFACTLCDRRFNFSKILKQHMFTHTGEKPFKCKHCDRAFRNSGDLLKHTRLHLGGNIYQCDQCSASFRYLKELRTHSAIHLTDVKENDI